MNNAIRLRVDEVAAELEGTCKSLESVTTEEELDNREFMLALDEQVFQCEQCGWWAATEERHASSQGEVCDECHDENEGEADE